jgi:methionyl-tRNA formyltransferase
MHVLVLSPYPRLVTAPILRAGDTYDVTEASPATWKCEPDFIVSYGYRHIIKEPILSKYENRIINIHIGLLPWNRGADPNFWSWFDNTPKGVTIHEIDAGLDTGRILTQTEMGWATNQDTLRTTHETLLNLGAEMFNEWWPCLRLQRLIWLHQEKDPGTYHKAADKRRFMGMLPLGWDTPVKDVEELGRQHRAVAQSLQG